MHLLWPSSLRAHPPFRRARPPTLVQRAARVSLRVVHINGTPDVAPYREKFAHITCVRVVLLGASSVRTVRRAIAGVRAILPSYPPDAILAS